MSKIFKKNKGPSQAELAAQARRDYEYAMKNQMSKEDAEEWRQDIQQDQLATAMPLFQQLIDTGMSANENNPMFQKLGGEATERPSLMELIGGQMPEQQQQQQQPQTPAYQGPYADHINAMMQQRQEQQAMAQQQGMAGQAGQQQQMGQPAYNQGAQSQMQAGQMGQQGQQGVGVPNMADINTMLKSFNINNQV
jgi:hypothetical protein